MRTAVPVPVKSTERATGGQCLFSLEIKLIVVVVGYYKLRRFSIFNQLQNFAPSADSLEV